ncbi:uncharacterized protein VTP21DRAFT_5148 [Calcarisporiella thermophila]|uniref:uncharacterized protein n=1 Tax=Calcarisporiella thermophila TaxID=911321 RepID=UPI00374202BC
MLRSAQFCPSPTLSSASSMADGNDWTPQEDELLRQAVKKFNGKAWRRIAEHCFPSGSRDKIECRTRWRILSKPGAVVKGPWTPEEDQQLNDLVRIYGPEKWVLIASHLGSRTGKQCRERWHNHLDPSLNKAPLSAEEEDMIFKYYAQMGSRWADMARLMPGRSDNMLKNAYNTAIQRRKRRAVSTHAGRKRRNEAEVEIRFNPYAAHAMPATTPNAPCFPMEKEGEEFYLTSPNLISRRNSWSSDTSSSSSSSVGSLPPTPTESRAPHEPLSVLASVAEWHHCVFEQEKFKAERGSIREPMNPMSIKALCSAAE